MSVWESVVDGLMNYKPAKKTLIKHILSVFNNGCSGDCQQGELPCNCERRYGGKK
jgi:hypothetical protein